MSREFSRRELTRLMLQGAACAAAVTPLGFSHPVRAASVSAGERRFLFLFCWGGWDFTYVFQPMFDNKYVSEVEDSDAAESNGISFVSSESRPAVDDFFETYGDRTCVINGIEVPSVAHDRCERLTITGGVNPNADDFASIIAAHSPHELLMPHAILSGPGYSSDYGGAVVRIGENGQLPALLDGTIMQSSEREIVVPSADVEDAVDAFVRQRAHAVQSAVGASRLGDHTAAYGSILERLQNVGGDLGEIELDSSTSLDLSIAANGLFEMGLARCAMVENLGQYSSTWDSHADNIAQNSHFELLFQQLNVLLADLERRTSPTSGNSLLEETTVVVISEMGRSPMVNGAMGKDHWTWTSAMLIGSGVQGGQTIGQFNDEVTGDRVDLDSGEVYDDGDKIDMSVIGATLMALADVDYAEHLNNTAPLMAAIDS